MANDVIILCRHGKPALSRKVWLTSKQFREWWRLYDEGGLAPNQVPPQKVLKLAKKADVVISSTLRRAIESAHLASGVPGHHQTPLMIEAALPPPPLGPIKFGPRTWGTLSRIKWCLGFSGQMETQKQARVRAKEATDLLIQEAQGGKVVFVAAHGWFNRMVRPALKRRGYVCTADRGDRHWSYRTFERPSSYVED